QPKELSSRNMTETASALEVIFTLSPVPSLTLTPAASSTVTASPTPIPSETPIATLTDNPEVAQPWAIIFSNDSSLEEAQFEANRAIRLGYTDTVIYKTTSWYVTVIRHFASRDEALASLQSDSVMKTNRPNAYVDDLDRLCPVQVSRAQYVECAAS
ncbi:MAG: SPOR domain-containing protein, partial [Anaerolineae bacterium]|nr:SPOR domain-containing protein [Anaerolineae bacterium]